MSRRWLESLSPEARAKADALIAQLDALGAPNPAARAHREFHDGSPQVSRYLLLRHLRDGTIEPWRDSTLWIENLAAEAEEERAATPSPAAIAVARLLDAGADRADLAELARFVSYETTFAVLHALDEGYDPDREDSQPGWVVVERDPLGNPTGRQLVRLHLDLTEAPDGREPARPAP